MSVLINPYSVSPSAVVVTARAFRIQITQRSNGSGGGTTASGYMNLRLGLADVVGGPNICCTATDVIVPGASGVTSSTAGSNGGNFAWTDLRGDSGSATYWATDLQAAPWWAYIDFGAGNTKSISQFYIVPTNTGATTRTPYEFYFQTSSDAVNWTNVKYVTGVTGWVLNTEKAWVF